MICLIWYLIYQEDLKTLKKHNQNIRNK